MKITNFKNIIGTALGLAILAGGATATHAQETQTQPQAGQQTEKQWKQRRGEGFRRGGRHGGHRGGMRAFGQLNLTEAQKQQLQQIHESYRENNKALYEQMRAVRESSDAAKREQLFSQFKETRQKMRAEMLNVLTAEQKTQLEQLKAERKQQREQRRQLFEQRRQQRQAQPAPSSIN